MKLDWDHYFFVVRDGDPETTYEDYQEWLFDVADLAFGE